MKKAELRLTNLAKALDECEKDLVTIKLRHGIVMSKYGYVLPFKHRWVVRMLMDGPYSDDSDDDD